MFRSRSRGDLHTGSAALLRWPSKLSLRLMRLFARTVRASTVQRCWAAYALHGRQASRVKTISSLTARIAPNQTLRPPVSWAPAYYRLCRCNHKAGAWKMHANLADLTITASDHDLMDVRGDQFTDNRIASSIVRRDGNGLARFPTDGILRIDGRPGDRCGIPCYIKRLLRAHLASPAMADSRNALSPSQEPRKAVERRRRRSEILSQEPNRMIGGEIGEASGSALQERAPVSQRLIQPIEMRAQLIKQVRHRRHHCDGIDISTGELGPVFEKPLRQRVGSLRERDADSRAEGCLLGPPGKRVGCAAAGGIKARSGVPALEFAHDQLAVAIDVRANLQNRRLAIASRQRRQIRFRHDDGKLDRCPGKALEAKPGPNFLRIGRNVVMVQDDISHGRNPSLFLFIFWNASAFSMTCLAMGGSPCLLGLSASSFAEHRLCSRDSCRFWNTSRGKLLQSDPLVNEQPALPTDAAAISGKTSISADDPVARNHNGNRVCGIGQANRTDGFRAAQLSRQHPIT